MISISEHSAVVWKQCNESSKQNNQSRKVSLYNLLHHPQNNLPSHWVLWKLGLSRSKVNQVNKVCLSNKRKLPRSPFLLLFLQLRLELLGKVFRDDVGTFNDFYGYSCEVGYVGAKGAGSDTLD